jgi:hypothetical protein
MESTSERAELSRYANLKHKKNPTASRIIGSTRFIIVLIGSVRNYTPCFRCNHFSRFNATTVATLAMPVVLKSALRFRLLFQSEALSLRRA